MHIHINKQTTTDLLKSPTNQTKPESSREALHLLEAVLVPGRKGGVGGELVHVMAKDQEPVWEVEGMKEVRGRKRRNRETYKKEANMQEV